MKAGRSFGRTSKRALALALLGLVALVAAGANATGSATAATARRRNSLCGHSSKPPRRYASVVVFAFENRTWDTVGMGFGDELPYLQSIARRCTYFTEWTEARAEQSSLSQYVAQITGAPEPATVNDCEPSETCSTQADSIFRQLRTRGRRAVNYVDGATQPCSAEGNAAKHVPALYLWNPADRPDCGIEVRPLADFDPRRLPALAFITPTLCNDGHDCANAVVDQWASVHVQPVLESAAYRAGRVAVFVWYDEDTPVPNLWIAPTARPGAQTLAGAGYAGTLRAWQSMLGLPCLVNACTAPDMRAAARA